MVKAVRQCTDGRGSTEAVHGWAGEGKPEPSKEMRPPAAVGSSQADGMSTAVEVAGEGESMGARLVRQSRLRAVECCCGKRLTFKLGSVQGFFVVVLGSCFLLALGYLSRDPLGRPALLGRCCQVCALL